MKDKVRVVREGLPPLTFLAYPILVEDVEKDHYSLKDFLEQEEIQVVIRKSLVRYQKHGFEKNMSASEIVTTLPRSNSHVDTSRDCDSKKIFAKSAPSDTCDSGGKREREPLKCLTNNLDGSTQFQKNNNNDHNIPNQHRLQSSTKTILDSSRTNNCNQALVLQIHEIEKAFHSTNDNMTYIQSKFDALLQDFQDWKKRFDLHNNRVSSFSRNLEDTRSCDDSCLSPENLLKTDASSHNVCSTTNTHEITHQTPESEDADCVFDDPVITPDETVSSSHSILMIDQDEPSSTETLVSTSTLSLSLDRAKL